MICIFAGFVLIVIIYIYIHIQTQIYSYSGGVEGGGLTETMSSGAKGAAARSRVSIASSVKKTIENIKEITGQNHSEDEIYTVLKECSMDPNETAQKLLLLGEILLSFCHMFFFSLAWFLVYMYLLFDVESAFDLWCH